MYLYLNIHRNKIDVYMSLCQIIDSVQVYSDWYVFVWFYLRFIYTSIYSFILIRNYIFRTIIRLAQLWFCLWHWGLLNPDFVYDNEALLNNTTRRSLVNGVLLWPQIKVSVVLFWVNLSVFLFVNPYFCSETSTLLVAFDLCKDQSSYVDLICIFQRWSTFRWHQSWSPCQHYPVTSRYFWQGSDVSQTLLDPFADLAK